MQPTKRLLAILLSVMMILGSLPLSVFAAGASEPSYDTTVETELADYLLYQTTYVDNTYVGATAKVSVYADTAKDNKTVPTDMRDVIVYVMNWNGEKIGTESDVNIVKSYIEAAASPETKNKALVVVLDYGYSGGEYAKNAVRGVIEHSVGAYRLAQFMGGNSKNNTGTYKLGNVGSVEVNATAVYFLPEGYRVERDILFWESDYHSSLGTMNSVLKTWNNEIANPDDNDHSTVYYDYYVESDFEKVETVTKEDGSTEDVITKIDNRSEWDKKLGATVGSPKHDEEGNIVPYPDGHDAPKVSRVEDCLKSDGSPMDYNVRLDIIHPAFKEGDKKVETPVVMVAATQSHRMDNQINGVRNYLGAFLFGGYTGVVYDYAYKPTARQDHYGYNDEYGTHYYNAAKWARAAVRCVRYYAETFGYNDELIGVMGISKGTPTAATLAVNHNELVKERSTFEASKGGTLFEGRTEGGVENLYQPFSQYENGYDGKGGNAEGNPVATNTKKGNIDSNITVAYAAAGDGIDWHYQNTNLRKHIAEYGTVPMVLSCGASDPYGCYNRWFPLLDYKAANANAPYLAMQMEDKGHEYPNGIDPIRDYDRYEYFYKFFDAYLKPAEEYAPSVMYITPKDGTEDAAYSTKIEVQFFANTKVEIAQVEKYVTVKAEDGTVVTGTWSTTKTAMSNLFTFVPDRLEIGTEYTVTVSKSLKDANGVALEAGKSASFTVEGLFSADPIEDTHVSTEEPDKSFMNESKLVVGRSANGETIALITYDRNILDIADDTMLVIPEISNALKTVNISVIDGYEVSSATTYNSVKSYLESAELLNETSFAKGEVRVSVASLLDTVKSDKFTIVIRGIYEESTPHYFEQKFDSTLYGFKNDNNMNNDAVKENEGFDKEVFGLMAYSKHYDYSCGFDAAKADIKIATDTERGSVGKVERVNGRYRFYNSLTRGELTEKDIGRTFKVTFWAKAVPGESVAEGTTTYIYYGLMQPKSSTSPAEQLPLTEQWQKCEYEVTFNAEMTAESNPLAMFSFVTPGTEGFTYYIDDIIVEETFPASEFASQEGAERSTFLISNTKIKEFADAYVSSLYADKNFGNSSVLKVNGGENENIALVSFRKNLSEIQDNTLDLKLSVLNDSDLKVKISYIEGFISENTVTYNSIKSKLDDATAVGEYTLKNGAVSLDVSKLRKLLGSVSTFTLVIEAAEKDGDVLNIDFEEYAVDSNLPFTESAKVGTHYYVGDKGYVGIRGSNNPYKYDLSGSADNYGFTVKQDADGNKYGVIAASNTRLSLLNAYGYDAEPLPGTYTLSFKIRKHSVQETSITAAKFNYGIRDLSIPDWVGSTKSLSLTDEWQTVTLSFEITDDYASKMKAGTSRPLFTLHFGTSKARYDIDEMIVTSDASKCAATISSAEHTSGKKVELVSSYHSELVPVADAYVSKVYPDKNFGASSTLMVTSGEDEAIALASFSTGAIHNVDYLSLNLPVLNNAYVPVDVSIIKGYCVDQSTVTYNNIQSKLAEKVSLGTYTLREGLLNVDLTAQMESLKAYDYFTIVITADEGTASHMLNIDFEEYETGTTLPIAQTDSKYGTPVVTTAYYMGDEDIIGVKGYNSFATGDTKAFNIKQEVNGNKYSSMKPNVGTASRWGILNGFAHRELTANDVGKTYLLTFRIRLAEGSAAGSVTYGMRAWLSSGAFWSGSKTTDITGTDWVELSVPYTIVTKDTSRKVMFTIEFSGKNSTVYEIDDVRVVEDSSTVLEKGAFISSAENVNVGSNVRLLALNSEEDGNKILADAYVVQGDDKSYGQGDTLTLTGKEGANAMIYTTFMTSILEGKDCLKLPAEGIYDGQEISVAVIDNVVVDEAIFNYDQGQVWVKNYDLTKFVGRYKLNKDAPYINVSDIQSLVSGGVFTLVIQADQKHELFEDFEGGKKVVGNNAISANRAYDSTYLGRTGNSGGGYTVVSGSDEIGNTTKVFQRTSGNLRFKFYNSISYDDITVLDTGRKYTAMFDMKTTYDGSKININLMAANSNGNGIATGPSLIGPYSTTATKFATTEYSNHTAINTKESDSWKTYSVEIALDDALCNNTKYTAIEAAVRFQAAMLTINPPQPPAADDYLYMDNVRVTETTGNTGVTTSTFNSRESGKETMSFITFGGKAVELDNVNVIETSVSLASTSEGRSDLIMVLGSSSCSLLTLDNASGTLGFVKDGTFYTLCNDQGEAYTVTATAIPVAVIYDAENGTVRYAVDGKLAYYMDGTECKNTYGTLLADGSNLGTVKIGPMAISDATGVAALNVTGMASELPRVIGTQTHAYADAVRIVGGIDMLYYSKMGYIVKRGESSIEKLSTKVYTTIQAGGETVKAAELECEYITMLALMGVNSGATFTVTPVAYVDDVKLEGESVTYVVTVSGGAVSVSKATE